MIGNDVVKKIISKNDEKVWAERIIGSKILGYYKNPYENSIVVVANYYRYTSYRESDTLWGTLNLFGYNMDDIVVSAKNLSGKKSYDVTKPTEQEIKDALYMPEYTVYGGKKHLVLRPYVLMDVESGEVVDLRHLDIKP
jgi:hypothetical protein